MELLTETPGIMETLLTWVNEFLLQLILITIAYVLMVVAVLVDLRSGVRKAKERGEYRSSFGLRKTVKKANEYGNLMLILTIVDCLQMLFLRALNHQITFHVPILPVLTFVGVIGVCYIEYCSVKEKASEKTKIEDVEKIVMQLARDRELLNAVKDIIQKNTQNNYDTKRIQNEDLSGDFNGFRGNWD